QRAGYRDQVPNRLAALGAGVPDIDTRTHPVEHTQHASARRIEAYTGNVRTGRAQQAECEQERGGREVAGNVEVEWPQRRNRPKGHTHTLAVLGRLDRRTLRGKHPLRVIAREAWLAHRNGHSAHEPRQEERTLYLRARVRGVEADRLEASAAHTYRQQASLAQVLEARTHPCEGLRYARHGARAQRRVARQLRGDVRSCQDAEQQPRGRAAVAAVDHPLRRAQTVQPDAAHVNGRVRAQFGNTAT